LPLEAFEGVSHIKYFDINQNCLDCDRYTALVSGVGCTDGQQFQCPLPTCYRDNIWNGCFECANNQRGANCITCNYGYMVSEGTCVKCGENMFCPRNSSRSEEGCAAFTRDNCTLCKENYDMKDGYCVKRSKSKVGLIVGLVIFAVIVIVAIIVAIVLVKKKNKKRRIQQLNQASVSNTTTTSSSVKPLLSTTKSSNVSMQPLFGKFKNLIVSETPFENGAFGAVYLADLDGAKTIVRVVSDVSDANKAELKKSIEKLGKMSDACLIRYLGIAEVSSKQEIIMDYVGGKSLKLVAHSSEQSLNPEMMERCLKDICYAMSYLHSQSIVHKFLRLYNVILMDGADETSVSPIVKLTEYGIGRSVIVVENEELMSVDPSEGFYNAPELLDESESESVKTDVYSFGILIADLWNTEDFAVDSSYKSKAAFNDAVVSEGLRPRLDDSCPEHLQKLAIACWQKKASSRPNFNSIIASYF